jgi:putative transposase
MDVDDRTISALRNASDEEWARASRIARELDRVLDGKRSQRDAIPRAAAELRLSTRQVYNLLARYRVNRRVSALLPRTSTTRRGRIDPQVETIIEATLRELWLQDEEPALAPAVEEIRARCAEARLKQPAYVTVERRIAKFFTPEEIARKRGCNESRVRRLKPRPGYIRAQHALQVCQIDHTPGDVDFRAELTREAA